MIFKLKQKTKQDLKQWHRHFVWWCVVENHLVVMGRVWRREKQNTYRTESITRPTEFEYTLFEPVCTMPACLVPVQPARD